ncbi:MAG: hypothetical protein Harvfovirus2_37 [Harvfovirus sp.]|uniref:Uncharacterized protein n=1 Tax=Harvfovirus sp. TaxID=2487768 RepID=A0A3G5A005_9VIRU|nr:MAG: hypothetical protein Harvfovirus2_37 [Harvfovirus sp.]
MTIYLAGICVWKTSYSSSMRPVYLSHCRYCGLNMPLQNLHYPTIFDETYTKYLYSDIEERSIKGIKLDFSKKKVNFIITSDQWNKKFCECPLKINQKFRDEMGVHWQPSFFTKIFGENYLSKIIFDLIGILNNLDTDIVYLSTIFDVMGDCWRASIFSDFYHYDPNDLQLRQIMDKEVIVAHLKNNCAISSKVIEILDSEVIALKREIKGALPSEFRDLIDCVCDYVSSVQHFNGLLRQIISDGQHYICDLVDIMREVI